MTKILSTLILLTLGSGSVAMQVDSVRGTASGGVNPPTGVDLAIHQGGGLTLDQAVQQVRSQYNGRIVSAETRVSGGRETHIIKVLLEDGTVKTVRVPGRNV
jgi:O-acetyl-ADP-ribose deacetylase (regulator of RNase III)